MDLNRLEHFVLSSLCDDIEPLHMLYADSRRELPDVTVDSFILALLKLYRLGLIKPCFFDYTRSKYHPLKELNGESLQKHFSMRTEAQARQYPKESFGGEYFFEITEKGREEEAKEAYSKYYPDDGEKTTVPTQVNRFLKANKGKAYCDDCLKDQLLLPRRQQAQQATAPLSTVSGFTRIRSVCGICGRTKVVTRAN